MSKETLPQNVEEFLKKNSTFNIFGIVSINGLKASTKCKIKDSRLKKLISSRFKDEIKGEIEYL